MSYRLLHVFSTFAPGGPQVRAAAIMNHLGTDWQHDVVAMDGRTGAAELVDPTVSVSLLPPPDGKWGLLPLRALLAERAPDLLLTYNWGAIEAATAAVWAGKPPCIHAEDGFGPDEAERLLPRRVWARRLLLPNVHRTVVPSQTLLRIASSQYKLDERKVVCIPNGVDTERFRPGRNDAVRAQLGIGATHFVIGFVGHLRAEKNVSLAIQALAQFAAEDVSLLIVGDGPCRAELESQAAALGVGDRVRFVGAVTDCAPLYGAMDLFCLSSDTEQMPVAMLEAMACGLPCVATDVGDCASLLDTEEPPVIVPRRDPQALAGAFQRFAEDAGLRVREAQRLRERCCTHFQHSAMLVRYEHLYLEAIRAGRRT